MPFEILVHFRYHQRKNHYQNGRGSESMVWERHGVKIKK